MKRYFNRRMIKTLYYILFSSHLFITTIYPSEQDLNTMNAPLIDNISVIIPNENSFYYSFNDTTHRDIASKLITMNNIEGMILGTPDSADISDPHNKIPLLWLQRFLSIRKWQVEKNRNSFLIITNLQNDLILIKYAYAGMPKRLNFSQIPLSAQGNPPSAARGIMAGIDMLDISKLLGSQLEPSRYAVTMTQYDWVSNTVQIQLVDSTGKTPEIPGIPESVGRQIYDGYKAAAQHTNDSALFSPSLNPPSISQNGIAAIVPPKVATKDSRWMLHGSIRVPVAPGAVVSKSGEQKNRSDIPSAIITAMVIVNKLDNREPSRITLKLPVISSCKAGELVDVSFSVDLKRFNDQFTAAGVYQVFIACGAFVAGPLMLEVVE